MPDRAETYMLLEYPSPAELCAIFGPHWAVCRNTETNRTRYHRCITRKQYQDAAKEILAARQTKGEAGFPV